MKKIMRVFCIALLSLVLATAAMAAEEPAFWAEEGAAFATAQQLAAPDELRPWDAATRAELAAMVTRLFGAEREADLTAFSDVDPNAWYAPYLARAVAMGLLQGADGKLQPAAAVTRQEAMVILGRTYGVCGGDVDALAAFSDVAQVASWARDSVSALVSGGYVSGADGKLNPKKTISRQELWVLLSKLTGTVVRDGKLPASGNVLLRTDGALRGAAVHGNLVLGGAEQVTLSAVKVDGVIAAHGGAALTLAKTTAAMVVTCGADVRLTSEAAQTVRALTGSATLTGGAFTLDSSAPVTLAGGCIDSAVLRGTTLTVARGARAKSVLLCEKNSAVTGAGTVDAAIVCKKNCVVDTVGTKITEAIDAGVADVVITAVKPAAETTPAAPKTQTTVRFTNVEVTNCAGAEHGVRYCRLQWFYGNQLLSEQADFSLTEGAEASCAFTTAYDARTAATGTLTVALTYADETATLSQSFAQHPELLVDLVETIEVEATALRDTPVYSTMNLGGWLGVMTKGTVGIYVNYSGTSAAKVVLPGGLTGWVRWSDVAISSKNYVRAADYSAPLKESFVNYKNYASTADYLVWVSLKTQKINVFLGKQGAWKLAKSFACCTGKNTTPTLAGVFSYKYLDKVWDFGDYYVKNAMVFNGGHAFHTRTYIKATSALLDATIGTPASHGCVRMYDEDVGWLVNNLPVGATVVVY
ncbi:MAG: S-layer homology domain-containing protein [Oscillospiraceae bacterium]|nr:S-layer homology domain-containing protein [Oscillospiraceae bacterium]